MTPLQFDDATPGRDRSHSRSRGRGRRGFTMVEIMVVVGILLVLMTIAAIAYRSLDNPVSSRSTQTTLQNMKGLLAEYEAASGLRGEPSNLWRGGAPISTGSGKPPASIWTEEAVIVRDDPLRNGIVSSGSKGRYGWDAVGNTQRVIFILSRMPLNKQAIARLPSRQVQGIAEETPAKPLFLTAGSPTQLDPPLILDAWGNPIIFVGSRGLAGVDLMQKPHTDGTDPKNFDRPDQRVTSVGVVGVGVTPLPSGARPFFASAGPDGNFRTGDDNVYSFTQ